VGPKPGSVTRPRYRRSSVRGIVEAVTRDPNAATEAHDALWATLWNRRYEEIDEPLWAPDAVYAGIVVFARRFPEGTPLTALDTNDALIVVRGLATGVALGSRVRVLPGDREQWRIGDGAQQPGLGLDLRFDNPHPVAEKRWLETLRVALRRVGTSLEARREQLAARRSRLTVQSEPPSAEELWRAHVAAIQQRVTGQCEYSAAELSALARARAKGPRGAAEEQRIVAARRMRAGDLANAEIARFRERDWPALRDGALERARAYAEYHDEVVKLEHALGHLRAMLERAGRAMTMVDAIERAEFDVRAVAFDEARLTQPGYVEEVLRTIELLHAAVPQRGPAATTRFSEYRAPTAGPAVVPPRPI
jgi:hypothetical protein